MRVLAPADRSVPGVGEGAAAEVHGVEEVSHHQDVPIAIDRRARALIISAAPRPLRPQVGPRR